MYIKTRKINKNVSYAIRERPPKLDTVPRVVGEASLS